MMRNFETKVSGGWMTYDEFVAWIEENLSKGITPGQRQKESLYELSQVNLERMKRIEKRLQLNQEITDSEATEYFIDNDQIWWVITEAWCPDSAQTLPAIAALAKKWEIELRIILRDHNPEIMKAYTTNGSLSIPKLVSRTYQGQELFTWGPRPAPAQELLNTWKATDGEDRSQLDKSMVRWYSLDKTKTLQAELFDIQKKKLLNVA